MVDTKGNIVLPSITNISISSGGVITAYDPKAAGISLTR